MESRLEPLAARAAVGPLLREAVVGVGIYQGMEFILQRGMRDVALKAGTVAGRAARCAAALGGGREPGASRSGVIRSAIGRSCSRCSVELLCRRGAASRQNRLHHSPPFENGGLVVPARLVHHSGVWLGLAESAPAPTLEVSLPPSLAGCRGATLAPPLPASR